MHTFSLKDPAVHALRCRIPLLREGSLIGRGTFSAVFSTGDSKRVAKLTTDKSHLQYLVDAEAPQSIHKPIVLHNHGEIGKSINGYPLYLIELERLEPVRRGTLNGRLARRLVNYLRALTYAPEMAPKELPPVSPSEMALKWFVRELVMFSRDFGCRTDAKWANIMQRSDGTLVFSDPVFDAEQRDESFNRYILRRRHSCSLY